MFPDPTQAGQLRRRRLPVGAAVVLWFAAVTAGWSLMADYSYKAEPMRAGASAGVWPAGASLARYAGRPTLVVFLHPKCPCSQATLTELERLQSKPTTARSAKLLVVVATPAGADDSWWTSPLVKRSEGLPGSEIVIDRGGVVAGQFGATTSGTVMLYSATGDRLFAGGVTASRGHEGPNAGADAVASLLAGMPAPIHSIPAFGCRLVTSAPEALVHRHTSDMVRRNQHHDSQN